MRAWLYDQALLPLTSQWYREVLDRMPDRARLLDVGVGTAGALLAHGPLVSAKALDVVGVDIDAKYVERARRRVADAGLDDHITVHHEPLGAHAGGPYDAVYFAASFMLFDDPEAALRDASRLLAPGGRVFFTQTFQDRPSRFMEWLKPLLKQVTSIDFGRVTYEDDFFATLDRGGMDVTEHAVLDTTAGRSSRLVVAVPR